MLPGGRRVRCSPTWTSPTSTEDVHRGGGRLGRADHRGLADRRRRGRDGRTRARTLQPFAERVRHDTGVDFITIMDPTAAGTPTRTPSQIGGEVPRPHRPGAGRAGVHRDLHRHARPVGPRGGPGPGRPADRRRWSASASRSTRSPARSATGSVLLVLAALGDAGGRHGRHLPGEPRGSPADPRARPGRARQAPRVPRGDPARGARRAAAGRPGRAGDAVQRRRPRAARPDRRRGGPGARPSSGCRRRWWPAWRRAARRATRST